MIKIKLFLLFSFLFFTSMMTFGQMKISEKGFSKAVDLANYTYVKYSMTDDEEKKRFDERCDCFDNPSFGAIQKAINKEHEITILFSKAFDELKKVKFDLTQPNVADFLTESVFSKKDSTKYPEIYTYGVKRVQDKEFGKLKMNLRDEIFTLLNDYKEKESSIAKNEAISNEIKSKASSNVKSNKRGWFDGLTYQIDVFSILISILVSLILGGLIYNKYAKPENVSKDYVRRKIGDLNFNQPFTRNNSEITKLKNEIFELKNSVQKLQIPIKKSPPIIEYNSPVVQEPDKKTETFFYLSTPNGDGSFNESSMKSSFIPGTTIYKFKKEEVDNKASFIIDNREDAVKLALQYPNKNIEPCCEATNLYNANATNITTAKPGIAELNNGVWKITRKAEITYEN